MAFDFSCARELYRRRQHPRVLLGDDDLDRLRRQARTGLGAALMAALRRKAQHFADQIHRDRAWVDLLLQSGQFFWPKPAESFAWALPDMAMVGVLDRDAKLIDAVRQVFRRLPEIGVTHRSGGLVNASYYMPPVFVPYAYDLIAPDLDAMERRAYVQWAAAAHIRDAIDRRRGQYLRLAAHNMTLGGMVLALTTLLAIRGDAGAPSKAQMDADLSLLLRWFEATVNTSLGPEGYPEEDIGYGTVVAPSLIVVAEALMRSGVFDAYDALPRLAQFGRAMLHFVQPWGENLSNTGDHGDQLRERQFALPRLATRTGDAAVLWLCGAITYTHSQTFAADPLPELDAELRVRPGVHVPVSWLSLAALGDMDEAAMGRRPAPPAKGQIRRVRGRGAASRNDGSPIHAAGGHPGATPTAFRDRARGIVSFRSGWREDDSLLIFDGSQRSPSAPGHYHESCGHFSLSALGECFAIDTGRYNVEQNGHNVVLINGRSGRSTGGDWTCTYHPGRLIGYQPGEFVDTAGADSSHQHNCMWAWRWVGLVKGGEAPAYAWVVDDINACNDWGEYWWQLHSSPENRIATRGRGATITGWRCGNHLDVHLAMPPAGAYAKPHTLRWEQDTATPSSSKYVADPAASARLFDRPADMVHGPVFQRPRLLAKVTGYNGRMLAVMLPRLKGERRAHVRQVASLDNSLAVRIAFEGVTDTLIWAYEHRLLEADGIKARGQWCLVRRMRRSGRVLRCAGGDVSRLVVDGDRIDPP